jgi:hypothetical protein
MSIEPKFIEHSTDLSGASPYIRRDFKRNQSEKKEFRKTSVDHNLAREFGVANLGSPFVPEKKKLIVSLVQLEL